MSHGIMLFLSKNSVSNSDIIIDEFHEIVKILEQDGPIESRIIDVFEEPDLADQYKIMALPTIIAGGLMFSGEFKADKILTLLRSKQEAA